MRNFIEWIKNDFRSSKLALSLLLNRDIPMWIFVLYYLAWMPIVLPLMPFVYGFVVYCRWKLKKLLEEA